jgi:hypothetical protein
LVEDAQRLAEMTKGVIGEVATIFRSGVGAIHILGDAEYEAAALDMGHDEREQRTRGLAWKPDPDGGAVILVRGNQAPDAVAYTLVHETAHCRNWMLFDGTTHGEPGAEIWTEAWFLTVEIEAIKREQAAAARVWSRPRW